MKSGLDPLTWDTLYPYEHTSVSGADENPRLDRTMSDVYEDSLYTAGLGTSTSITGARPASNQSGLLSPSRIVVLERLEAAKNGRLSARSQSPSDDYSAERLAFKAGSPFYPAPQTASEIRSGRQIEDDARVLSQHQHDDETMSPKVIVPGDALLGFGPFDPIAGSLDPAEYSEAPHLSPQYPAMPVELHTSFDEDNEFPHMFPDSPSSEQPDFVLHKE